VGRNQFLIAFQSQRLVPRPGSGVFSSDPRGFEGDGCDPGVSGCSLSGTGASAPYSNPVFANFTMIGPATSRHSNDGHGSVFRRGTAGSLQRDPARWKGIAINVRDAWTTHCSCSAIRSTCRACSSARCFHYDTVGGTGFGTVANFPAAQISTHKAYAANVAVDTLLGLKPQPTGLDWSPKAGSPATAEPRTCRPPRSAGSSGELGQHHLHRWG